MSDASSSKVVSLCSPQSVGTGSFGAGTPRIVRAIDVPSVGQQPEMFAVAVGTTAHDLYLVKVNPDLSFDSQHLPLAATYDLWSANVVHGNLLVGCLDTGDGHGYLKAISSDWNGYTAQQYGGTPVLDPPLAPLATGTTALYALVDTSGALAMEVIDMNGVTVSSKPANEAMPARVSVAGTEAGAFVVASRADGTCAAFFVDANATSGVKTSIPSCASPAAATLPDGTAAIAYVSGTQIRLHIVPPAPLVASDFEIGSGSNPRITAQHGAAGFFVAWTDPVTSQIDLGAFDAGGGVSNQTNAPGATFGFLPAADRAFWVAGSALMTTGICIQ